MFVELFHWRWEIEPLDSGNTDSVRGIRGMPQVLLPLCHPHRCDVCWVLWGERFSFTDFLAFYCETPKFFVGVIFTSGYAKRRFVKFYYSFLWNNYRVWGSFLKCANCFFPHFIDAFHRTVKDIAIIVFNCSYEDATTKFLFLITFKSQVNAIIMYVPTTSISILG